MRLPLVCGPQYCQVALARRATLSVSQKSHRLKCFAFYAGVTNLLEVWNQAFRPHSRPESLKRTLDRMMQKVHCTSIEHPLHTVCNSPTGLNLLSTASTVVCLTAQCRPQPWARTTFYRIPWNNPEMAPKRAPAKKRARTAPAKPLNPKP